MSTPIPNKSLETHSVIKPITISQQTPEQKLWLDSLKPQKTDSVGAKIQKSAFMPYKTTEQKAETVEREKARLPIEPEKELNDLPKTLTKELLAEEKAAGKTNAQIEREYGIRSNGLYYLVKSWEPKKEKAESKSNVGPEPGNKVDLKEIELKKAAQKVLDTFKPSWKAYDTIEDLINSPSHYTSGGIETIDYLQAKLTPEEFAGYLKGNVLKYVTREKHKGGIESLKKAQWYLNKLVDLE